MVTRIDASRIDLPARVVAVGGGHRLAVEEVELAGAFLAEAAAVG